MSQRKFTLTNRDQELFKQLNLFGILSTAQIQKFIFGGIHFRTVLRRLRKLERTNFIDRHSGLPNGQWTWTLSTKGLKHVGIESQIKINKNNLIHDITVNEVSFQLLKSGLFKKFQSAYQLKKIHAEKNKDKENLEYENIPDGILVFPTKQGTIIVSLEVELVAKSKARYRNIFASYQRNKAIQMVWYFVESERLGEQLTQDSMEFPKTIDKKPWLYWIDKKSIGNGLEKITLHSASQSIHFTSLISQPREQPQGSQSVSLQIL